MFFKNLLAYRLPAPWGISATSLLEQLGRGRFVPCPSNEPQSRGWISPVKNGNLVHSVGNQWMIALAVEERILPASVVADEVAERLEALEQQQGYAPGRKQRKDLKERVTEELLPKAFRRRRVTHVWIDSKNGWFVVNASSSSKAEAVIEHLRHCLDDFPLKQIHTKASPSSSMADWLASGEAPDGFTIDRDCELKALGEEKSSVRYARHPLDGDTIGNELKEHLSAGKLPTRLAMTWNDRLSFVLGDKLEIKRLAFLDLIKEDAEKAGGNVDEQFDANLALMAGELSRFYPALLECLGGEVDTNE